MTRRVLLGGLFILVCVGAGLGTRAPAPTTVRASQSDPIADTAAGRGRAVYTLYGCSMCHGAEGKGGFENPNSETDGKVPGVIFVAEGYTRRELRQYILRGNARIGKADPNGPQPPYRMPGWTGSMSEQEIGDLVEYLFSIYPKSEKQGWR